jgi:thioesterase domain-containing protein/acyl carrier protein
MKGAEFMSDPGGALAGPRAPVSERLAAIWCRALGRDRAGPADDFFDCGGDSLAAVQLLLEIERAFGRRLPATVLHEAPTLADLARLLEQPGDRTPWSALVPLQPLGSGPPFFCVPGVGGTVLGLAELARLFAPGQRFYGISTAGSDDFGDRFPRIEDMAADCLRAVRTIQPAGPYHLGGFSFGGSVALEMAQQLHARGERVALLAILDHMPPPARYEPLVWTPRTAVGFAGNAVRWLLEDVWHAPGGRRLATLWRKATAARNQLRYLLKRSARASSQADMQSVFPGQTFPEPVRRLLAAQYQALRDYVPRAYPGRVTLFRARTRPLFRLHAPDLAWGPLAGGGLEIFGVPGNHETMLKPPHVRELADALLLRLGQAQDSYESRKRERRCG